MKILFPLTLAYLISIGQGCSSQGPAQKPESAGSPSHEAKTNDTQLPVQEGTSIKRNGASVTISVESVSVLGDDKYTLYVRLDSAVAIEGMDSPAVPGQWLTLSPGYVLDEKERIDRSIDRNKRLMDLQSARQGDQFKGKITYERNNGWVLVDVEKK